MHQETNHPPGRGVLAISIAVVFLASFLIMTLELVAARLVAQHLGVSLYTWTSVIGVILAGMSLGNYIGGKLADVHDSRYLLPALLLFSSAIALCVLPVVSGLGQWSRPDVLSWPLWILLNVAASFLLPAGMLGTISPVAAKMGIEGRENLGSALGTIYAWGAAGSIAGTFVTGFVLIDVFGTRAIVGGIAAALAIMSFALSFRNRRSPIGFFLLWICIVGGLTWLSSSQSEAARHWGHFLALRFDEGDLLLYDESNYFAIEIYDDTEVSNTRVLALDHLVHAYVPMDDATRLEYPYETVYAAVTERVVPVGSQPRSFFIGGGGYVFPRYLEAIYDGGRIDVAEIDPAVTHAARVALALAPEHETRIRPYAMDARNFVEDRLRAASVSGDDAGYELVFGDAFNDFGVPYHLTTLEFQENVRSILAPSGVYMINIIDMLRDGAGRFVGSYVNTARRVFPYVYVFSSDIEGPTDERDTFVIVSSMRRQPLLDLGLWPWDPGFEGRLFAWTEEGRNGGTMDSLLDRSGVVVLTDDYAPIDNMLAPVFAAQADDDNAEYEAYEDPESTDTTIGADEADAPDPASPVAHRP